MCAIYNPCTIKSNYNLIRYSKTFIYSFGVKNGKKTYILGYKDETNYKGFTATLPVFKF